MRQAIERDDAAVIVWKDQVRPDIKGGARPGAYLCFEDEAGQGHRLSISTGSP